MISRVRALLLLPVILAASAAGAETLRFHGTIGEQGVTLTLDVRNELVTDAKYKYDSQQSEVPIPESRLFGATVVLADDDGNNFHLHLQDANGGSVATFTRTLKLTGTMQRDDLDLPVKLDLVTAAKH